MNQIYYGKGKEVPLSTGSRGRVVLRTDTELYRCLYIPLGSTAKRILESIFEYMAEDMNTIQVGGDTLEAIMLMTGYSEKTVRNQLVELNKLGLLESTDLRGEYIVNPVLAYKGNEYRVWEMYKVIEENKK